MNEVKPTEEQLLYDIFGGSPPKEYPNTSIKLKYCGICGGFYVECPKCGNNTCNGTYGTMPDGTHCDVCETMYDIMYKLGGSEESVVNKTNLGEKIDQILQQEYPPNDNMANMAKNNEPKCICPDNCTDESCPVCIPDWTDMKKNDESSVLKGNPNKGCKTCKNISCINQQRAEYAFVENCPTWIGRTRFDIESPGIDIKEYD